MASPGRSSLILKSGRSTTRAMQLCVREARRLPSLGSAKWSRPPPFGQYRQREDSSPTRLIDELGSKITKVVGGALEDHRGWHSFDRYPHRAGLLVDVPLVKFEHHRGQVHRHLHRWPLGL